MQLLHGAAALCNRECSPACWRLQPRAPTLQPRGLTLPPPRAPGGSGRDSPDQCFNGSQFGRGRYAVGNWGKPQSKLPNSKAHAGYWGREGRCLRRPFDPARTTAFISESRLHQLLRTCDMPFEAWMLLYEKLVKLHSSAAWVHRRAAAACVRDCNRLCPRLNPYASTCQVHDPVHDFTLGHMVTPISSHDPLFWLHHAGLDRGYSVWQQFCARSGGETRRCGR